MFPRTLLCILAVAVAGCGASAPPRDSVYKASGVVKYKGNPIADVYVTFHPEKGRPATGLTNANGEFTLTTFNTGDGAIEGQHKVVLAAKAATEVESNSDAELAILAEAQKKLPAKYTSLDNTPQINTVEAGKDNKFEINLED